MEASQALDEGSIPFARFFNRTLFMEENDTPEFDTKPAVNKDVWLLLIVLDVVAMCVLGFYLYKYFAPQFAQQSVKPVIVQEETIEAVSEDISPVTEAVLIEETTAPVVTQPEIKVENQEQTEKPVAKPVPTPKTLVEEALESVEPEPAPQPEKKESIVVAQGKSTKYRQVTFRWFGKGKSVAVISGFTGSKPRKLQKKKDYWETTLAIAPGSYKFLYIVDGVNRLDPYAEEKEGRSVLIVK